MNQIQRHIEILLLDHDCVIVPGFGGFVAHQVPARYEAADRMFLPPTRTLGFNPQLTINDSLLVQSYIEAYDISYPEALRRIEDEVVSIKQQLSTQGSFTMSDLGTLIVNSEGNYEFSPCEAGILSPSIYGLSSFFFKHLGDQAEEPETAPSAQLLNIVHTTESDVQSETETADSETSKEASLLEFIEQSDDDDQHAIRIRMSWIRNAVAIAAAVVVFFLFATPVVNSDLGNQSMSQLQGNLLYRLIPQDSNMVPAEPVKAEPQPVVAQTPVRETEPVKAEPQQKTVSQNTIEQQSAVTSQPSYCIVVASQVKLSNAESFVEQLHQQGYQQARVFIHNNIVRVICGEYSTQAEAYTQLNKLNDKQEFAEAWVYKKAAV